ncbi:protein argonaute-2-like [Dendronephthya gigantea]|uniref:protein argonaute-2-like n=1 Tax=Dendronephthya gigantea TaxID=151771 RepID=UPI00106C28A7|nr:protein argonaute-2-like [Dendronephthya gigantea]
MSEPGRGRGGKRGKGRGRKHGGKGGRGQQQQQRESTPGGLQEFGYEQRGASAMPERRPGTEQPQASQQPEQETRQGSSVQPEERPPEREIDQQHKMTKSQKRRAKKKARDEPEEATTSAELKPQETKARSEPQQQQVQQTQKPQQTKEQSRGQPDGAGPSKPQEQPSATPSQKVPRSAQTPPTRKTQPSTQPQPSTPTTRPGPPQQQQQHQPPHGAEKPEPRGEQRGSPTSHKAVPKPPRRPDSGGKSGRPIQLRANFLPVELPTEDIHHYDTDIKEKGKKSGEGYTKAEAPKIIGKIVELYEKENPTGPKLVYDRNGKNMYCRTLIPKIGKDRRQYTIQHTTENGKEKTFIVEVQYAAPCSLYALNEVLKGRQTDVPYDTMQAIEVVLQQLPKMRKETVQVRSSFYELLGHGKDLGAGVQVWNGTFVSIRPTQWKMMLNVDTCATGFYKAQPVLDFVCEFLNLRDYPTRLDERQRRKLAKEIKAIKVETTHMRRKQKASGLSVKSAREETFDCEGQKMTVMNYFKSKYGINLRYSDLPCVKIGQKGSLIPMELCVVAKGQKKQGRLTGRQTQQMIRHTAIPAPDRMQKIMDLIRKLNYESDPYSRDFGIRIINEMVTIQGRVLEPPTLMYGPGNRPARELPRDGAWKMTKKMLDPKELREWAVISYINENAKGRGPLYLDNQGIDNLIYYLVEVGREKGVRVNENPCFVTIEKGFFGTNKLFGNLKARYPNLQLILVVLPIDGDDFYEEVKHCGDVVHGITTQCIKFDKASSDFSDWRKKETLVNLWLKINAKLGGTTCALHRDIKSPILRDPVIIFGADVTHPGAGDKSNPSIAAVVASKDSYPTLYNAEVRVQKHRQEMIEDLKDMVKILLRKFRASTNAIPGKIIFYRDGVSEGQFKDVLINELSAIQKACLELQPGYTPAITFVVVQKRHHARLFAVDPRDRKGKSQNIPAGTVVDRQICHPSEFNWYLCSHAGIQGTSKPALYHVLYDDSNFSSDELQILTYQLCYTYVRCARSVSIPAPAYYAHHVAFRARHHLKIENSTEGSTASDDSGPKEVTQEMKNLVTVHPNVNCTMYFA